MKYLSVGETERLNALAVALLPAKQADAAKLVARHRLKSVIEACRTEPGDMYAKATAPLKGLIQQHPFASGNRRTAMLAAKAFIKQNGGHVAIADTSTQARVLQGIRERYDADEEIQTWLKTGNIREFVR